MPIVVAQYNRAIRAVFKRQAVSKINVRFPNPFRPPNFMYLQGGMSRVFGQQ